MTVIPVPDKERDRAFEKFFPLIKPIASRFVQTYRLPKDQTEDLEQEGSIGLLNAAAHRGDLLSSQIASFHFEGLRTIHRTAETYGLRLSSYNHCKTRPTSQVPLSALQYDEMLESLGKEPGAVTENLACPFCPPYILPLTASLDEIRNILAEK